PGLRGLCVVPHHPHPLPGPLDTIRVLIQITATNYLTPSFAGQREASDYGGRCAESRQRRKAQTKELRRGPGLCARSLGELPLLATHRRKGHFTNQSAAQGDYTQSLCGNWQARTLKTRTARLLLASH